LRRDKKALQRRFRGASRSHSRFWSVFARNSVEFIIKGFKPVIRYKGWIPTGERSMIQTIVVKLALKLGAGSLLGVAAMSCMAVNPSPTHSTPLSIEALFDHCRLPAHCSGPLACDGSVVTVWGYLDQANSFDKRRHPNLPYEKFKLVDHDGRSVEVWPQAADNRAIFDQLVLHPTGKVMVTGRLKGVRLPTGGGCAYGVKVLIDDVSQLAFD